MKPKHIKKLLMSEIKKVASEPHKYCMNPIDGSDIQIPTNSADTESYIEGTNGHKGYNPLHINALYDLNKLDIKNPIIRISIGFKYYSSTKKATILPRIYHD